ncbi:hypothetical protein L208DRAFT_911330 [Tricholoma matsutake]|nr:hypothetical protein L208DRAFT_911330 [Tricholoma matsutake 945]
MGFLENITKPTSFNLLQRLTGSRSASTKAVIVNQRTAFNVADVLLNIMCLCDIATVISMSQQTLSCASIFSAGLAWAPFQPVRS